MPDLCSLVYIPQRMSSPAFETQINTQYTVLQGYRFFDLPNPEAVRFPLRDLCRSLNLVGTIILSKEGMNISLAGTTEAICEYKSRFQKEFNLPPVEYKEHFSERLAWRQIIVKIKKEIITMGVPDIRPMDFTGENLPAREFKKWLDEKRDITVIDTRNNYEIELGKFKSAVDLNVRTFSEFAKKAADLPQEMKEKPLVMYCTGGIRCEKASALFLKHYGFKEVYQLEGGILKYFKEVGGDHYDGECLVFDRRVGLNPQEVETNYCVNCKTPLNLSDYTHPKFIPFLRCPACANDKGEKA